jgi:WYL domain
MVPKTRLTAESRAEDREIGPLRWSVERRLAFIEERLFWLGEVNRTDLVRRFGVSMSQASADIARYLAHNPPGVIYDKSAKRYAAQAEFRPQLAKPDATRFLGELRLVEVGLLSVEDTMLGVVPPFDATPVPERRIDPFVLRAVVFAMRAHESLDVVYQSMSRPEAARRVIEPHALAYDGFRWHTRAFDRESGEFRDFVLGRLSKPKARAKANSRPEDDIEWQTFVDLVIAPHPGLTPAQSKAIAIDYGIHGSSTSIRVRRALLFYALKRLGLDIAPGVRPANEQHIVLLNRDEVQAALVRRQEI